MEHEEQTWSQDVLLKKNIENIMDQKESKWISTLDGWHIKEIVVRTLLLHILFGNSVKSSQTLKILQLQAHY